MPAPDWLRVAFLAPLIGPRGAGKMLAKGRKRKRSEEAPLGPPPGALVTISASKLHRSLQRGEPSLRRLVLVTNALRRIQGQAEPAAPQLCASLAPVDQLLLSGADAAALSAWEDATGTDGFGDPLHPATARSEEDGGPQGPGLGPLDLLGPEGYLLEEGLEGIFEDIDTSMYDCDLWLPGSLPHGKEAFSSAEVGGQDLADLDYLLDMLVGAQGP